MFNHQAEGSCVPLTSNSLFIINSVGPFRLLMVVGTRLASTHHDIPLFKDIREEDQGA